MTKSLTNTLALVLASLGCLLALLLTIESLAPAQFTLPCSTRHRGCEGTLNSDYSHWGPIPTAALGLGMYVTLAGLCLKRRKLLTEGRSAEEARVRAYTDSDTQAGVDGMVSIVPAQGVAEPNTPLQQQIRQLDLFVWLIALAGFGISWWLQYTSIFVLQSFCPYCFTSALLVTAILAFTSRDHLLDGRPMSGEQKMLGAVVAFVLVLMGFMIVPQALAIINGFPTGPVPQATKLRDILISKDMHTQGPAGAKFTIVEFADYMCPHCAEAAKLIPGLLTKRQDVRLAFRSYPLGYPKVKFEYSAEAAYAAEAAGLQNKFWEMHDFLFAHQKEITAPGFTTDQFSDYAQQLGLDVKKFEADWHSAAIEDRVAKDHEIGDRARMESTPTFFVITPDKVTSFIGGEELQKAMEDPKSSVWQ